MWMRVTLFEGRAAVEQTIERKQCRSKEPDFRNDGVFLLMVFARDT
ncbi:unnamed protein product [Chondrus crispus]|uniref:Uncharacterized protein n=1 Tax=Chondrus crispus TaxID=2769 RepID=S0F359_CHOCR|nr:unnamed protein product [Chondrus crispus]CDF77422.1 unnamed protein product [Chondrus crispus]|eukprot:XP_005712296.1 unnamed protein product [Chondrus crispus]